MVKPLNMRPPRQRLRANVAIGALATGCAFTAGTVPSALRSVRAYPARTPSHQSLGAGTGWGVVLAVSGAPVLRSLQVRRAAKAAKKEEVEGESGGFSLDPPSGTRDFFPEDMRMQRWLFDRFRETARLYGFQEHLELQSPTFLCFGILVFNHVQPCSTLIVSPSSSQASNSQVWCSRLGEWRALQAKGWGGDHRTDVQLPR